MGPMEAPSGSFSLAQRSVWAEGIHGGFSPLFSWALEILLHLRITGTGVDHLDVPKDDFENTLSGSSYPSFP